MSIKKNDKYTLKKTNLKRDYFVHPTAIVEERVEIGEGTKIWHFAQVRQGTKIGKNCIVANSVFIDENSQIGHNCKIQNHAIIYHQAIIADGVFIGPNVCFTNDKYPRAVNPNGALKSADDWEASTIRIGEGAAIGGHSVIVPGVTVGAWAASGAGAVVTKDVPDFALVYGSPARIRGFVGKCGRRVIKIIKKTAKEVIFGCVCGETVAIPKEVYKQKIDDDASVGGKKKIWIK